MSRGVKAAAIIAAVLGVTAAIVLGVFRIQSIDVKGNERYSAQQIRDDLIYDFKTRNTLYFAWKYRTKASAPDAPYLSSVQASMLSPTSVRIEVTENQIVGRVQYEESNVYYDSDGMVQEISDVVYTGIPLVSGVNIEEPRMYQKLVTENTSTLRTMLNITQLLVVNEMIPDSVTFDSSSNMTLRFGNVTVKLGQDEYLEEKIANLVTIYPTIQDSAGTLNMEGFTGKNEAITFRPDSASDETEKAGTAETEGSPDGSNDSLAGEGADGTASAQAGEERTEPEDLTAEGLSGEDQSAENSAQQEEETSSTVFMVFDSSGTLRYDAHVVGGQVVDSAGQLIDGCSVNEDGNVVDAYWNVIDPKTGQLAQ